MAKWYQALWEAVDSSLQSFADSAKKLLKFLRTLRAIILISIFGALALTATSFYFPRWQGILMVAAMAFLAIPHLYWYVILGLPLQAKSVVRLVDMGYPANARELGIRIAARKLHDESIETEELLVKTAWNESKKALRDYRQRAAERKDTEEEE